MHHCNLNEGQVGRCHARKNIQGENVCINYGKITSIALDPIEKKPLKCFFPKSKILSIGSFGCNLSCPFCQNYKIATAFEDTIETKNMTPLELTSLAQELVPQGNIGMAYTYNEPMIGFEFIKDVANEIKKVGLKNVVVTNGSVLKETLEYVLPYIDAFNIDLKGFTSQYYKKLGGNLDVVKEFISIACKHAHVELTTLIVPEENDSEKEMDELSSWVAKINLNVPLHISRFFPHKNMLDKPPTSINTLEKLAKIAKNNLTTVFIGNV